MSSNYTRGDLERMARSLADARQLITTTVIEGKFGADQLRDLEDLGDFLGVVIGTLERTDKARRREAAIETIKSRRQAAEQRRRARR